jgi:hypothetical protein
VAVCGGFHCGAGQGRPRRYLSLEASRTSTASALLESIAPATPALDSSLVHVVFLVRTFIGRPEEEATQADVEAPLDAVMDVFTKLGAFA